MKVLLAVGTITATLLAGVVGAAAIAYFDKPDFSTECAVQVTAPETVPHHMLAQLEMENTDLFDPTNTSCVLLRQRVLQLVYDSDLHVDGVYGDKTISAEIAYAKRNALNPAELDTLYRHMAETQIAPRHSRSHGRNSR